MTADKKLCISNPSTNLSVSINIKKFIIHHINPKVRKLRGRVSKWRIFPIVALISHNTRDTIIQLRIPSTTTQGVKNAAI